MTENNNVLKQQDDYAKKEYAKLIGYLSRRQIKYEKIIFSDSRILAPHFALWKVALVGGNQCCWVVTGDVPSDHIPFETADNARAALRYFALSWQLKAENIYARGESTSESQVIHAVSQKNIADNMVQSAEMLYTLADNSRYWSGSVQ